MSDDLLQRINTAVKAANETKAEYDSRSKAVGTLLLELKKLHPATKDFKAVLEKQVEGLRSLSWAYICMDMAAGRVTHEEVKKVERERKAKNRAKKKLAKPEPFRDVPEKTALPPPEVTAPDATTESEWMKAQHAAHEGEILEPELSARNLAEFKGACKTYLSRLNEADLKTARAFVTLDQWRPKAKKVA
jgi:hypothetical protein